MKSDFLIAITQLAAERNLPRELVLGAVESALAAAFKKDHFPDMNVVVKIHPATGDLQAFVQRSVVEAVSDATKEMTLAEAQKLKNDAKVGDVIDIEVTPPAHAGRIAAQTTKQLVLQRLREAERDQVYTEFATKVNDIVSGVVQRMEGRDIVADLGKAEGRLPPNEQVPTERYRPIQRLRFYVVEVSRTSKGPFILLSRTHKNLLKRLLEMEVPEVFNGAVEVRAIAREPGVRSKVAVFAKKEGVDAVGSCVGLRGMRIQNVVNELQGEKIDVVEWHRDAAVFLARSLAPAQVVRVVVNEKEQSATVVVPDRQLSLAIGKEGQNARLAAKLTGWHIDIKSSAQVEAEKAKEEAVPVAPAEAAAQAAPEPVGAVSEHQEPVSAPAEALQPAAAAPAALEPVAIPQAAAAAAEGAPAPTGESLEEALAKEETWKVPAVTSAAPQVRFGEEIRQREQAKKDKRLEEERAKEERAKKAGAKKLRYREAEPDEEEYQEFVR